METLTEKECEICGIWFTPKKSFQKYCPDCGKDSTRAWRTMHKHMKYSVARVGTRRPVTRTEKKCVYCGKEFVCYNGHVSDYCCKVCETADKIRNTFCAYCGKPMLETDDQRDMSGHLWYCSAECKDKNLFQVAKENGTLKKCPNCGKEFYKDSTFCCRSCYLEDVEKKKRYNRYLKDHGIRVCAECGKEYTGVDKFCSAECAAEHKKKEPHAYRECSVCGKLFLCPTSEMSFPICSDKCRQELSKKKPSRPRSAKAGWNFCKSCGKKYYNSHPSTFCCKECYMEDLKKRKSEGKVTRTTRKKEKEETAAEEKYISENGLCSICRTPYKSCERMLSNYTASPKGSVFSGSLVIKCPKYTPKKKKVSPR